MMNMNKPNVFISSTVYDFKDMRSAIKYWLEEAGYDVQLSEYGDFDKNSSQNSYDACLDVIHNCDYFILLIGKRVGNMYDKEISITRKEYRTAYELAKSGKIKRIITFVRQSISDILLDRRGLQKLVAELDISKNGAPYNKDNVTYHDSKLICSAKHIQSFINEVARKDEFQNNEKPLFNWINVFNDFYGIIEVLKVEMQLKNTISRQAAEMNLKAALIQNLREISFKSNDGRVGANFIGFKSIHTKIGEALKAKKDMATFLLEPFQLTSRDVHNMSSLLLFCEVGVDSLESYLFEQVLSSGVFLDYNKDKARYESNNINRALRDMIIEIKRLKGDIAGFESDKRFEMLESIRGYKADGEQMYRFSLGPLAQLNSIYERQQNIYSLTQYLMRYILHHDNIDDYPILLKGFVEDIRPSEKDILNIFE